MFRLPLHFKGWDKHFCPYNDVCAPDPFPSDYVKRLWGTKGIWVFYPLCQNLQASWRGTFRVHRATPSLGFRLRASDTIAAEEKVRLHRRRLSPPQDHLSLHRCRALYVQSENLRLSIYSLWPVMWTSTHCLNFNTYAWISTLCYLIYTALLTRVTGAKERR